MWCNWKGVPSNWAGPLLRWWPLGRSMPCQIFTVFEPSFFISGFIHHNLSMWSRILHDSPVHSTFLCYLFSWGLVWMQQNFSFHLRVHFKVKFIAASHPLPVRFSQTVKPVKPFLNLSLKLFWTKWPMDLCRSGGSGGSVTSQHGYAHHHWTFNTLHVPWWEISQPVDQRTSLLLGYYYWPPLLRP